MLNFKSENTANTLITFFIIFLVGCIVTYISICWIQALLLLLWGIEQTKLQIFVAGLILRLLTWN